MEWKLVGLRIFGRKSRMCGRTLDCVKGNILWIETNLMNFIFLKCDLCVLPQFPLIYKFSIKFNTLLNFLSEFPLEMRETQSVEEIQNQTDGVVECVLLRLGSTPMRCFYPTIHIHLPTTLSFSFSSNSQCEYLMMFILRLFFLFSSLVPNKVNVIRISLYYSAEGLEWLLRLPHIE